VIPVRYSGTLRATPGTLVSACVRYRRSVPVRYRFPSLEDFLTASELTVDGTLDDGWGAQFAVKGRELEATILFADISDFSGRTASMTPTETLAYVNNVFAWISAGALRDTNAIVDKYIGEEVMVVYAREFGSEDLFVDAFRPHVGCASTTRSTSALTLGLRPGP
jgi:class 3 adenylate cyclase